MARHGGVEVFTNGKVVTAIAQEKTASVGFFAVGREQDARGTDFFFLGKREKAERQPQRQRHIGDDQVERPRHHLLVVDQLDFGRVDVKVRVREVAGSIDGFFDV